ncbi:hypothetical protein PGN35_002315 [Nodosilinea sp. PGN35]|uniref:hypothetical protein n=1 Tax=Nodosilinea sp. PGN35 TaxID=3020489 RepID=UPI0023B221AA|nr:hypothetical protein [Nodosilinea sp. TSF1-S3]MDF0368758.1 hypothetical protein [Nodosilinea sp. TSF1-S3]
MSSGTHYLAPVINRLASAIQDQAIAPRGQSLAAAGFAAGFNLPRVEARCVLALASVAQDGRATGRLNQPQSSGASRRR